MLDLIEFVKRDIIVDNITLYKFNLYVQYYNDEDIKLEDRGNIYIYIYCPNTKSQTKKACNSMRTKKHGFK